MATIKLHTFLTHFNRVLVLLHNVHLVFFRGCIFRATSDMKLASTYTFPLWNGRIRGVVKPSEEAVRTRGTSAQRRLVAVDHVTVGGHFCLHHQEDDRVTRRLTLLFRCCCCLFSGHWTRGWCGGVTAWRKRRCIHFGC